jgi:hypothetical protein
MYIFHSKLYYLRGVTILFLLFFVSCTFGEKGSNLYVSTDGNDNNSGTKEAPFYSLEKTWDMVRLIRKENPGKAVTVYIKGGIYHMENPLILTSEDSGTENAPVVYKAVDGEEPVFTGSRELKNWKLSDNPEKLEFNPAEVRDKIYVADVKAAGISDFGDHTETGKRPELFCNGELQTLARWPNEGFVNAGLAKGKTELPKDYRGKQGRKEGVFEYLDNRQNRWASEKDVRLGGYWYWDWSDEFQQVEKVDTGSKTFYLSEPFHTYGYRDSLRYFGLNLLCEIDRPGEWYLDRTDGLLYWYPPADVDPNQAKVTLSVFNDPFIVEMKNCSHFTLQGLAFQESRGSAVLIQDGENCLVSDCRIERFGEDGIHIEEGTGHGVSGCLLRTFGCGGISVRGGDRKNLVPANHFVENTVVENFSLFKRTYEPAVYVNGCGIRISNNRFRYSSSSAMRLNGNDITVEYNEISHVVNESDDQGGVDMYYDPSFRGVVIRYNRWSDIRGGTLHGAAGVRLDDMISGVTVFGNIFERCGALHFGGVQIHGGKDNLIENNLFYDCFAAVSFTPYGEKRWFENLDFPVIKKKIYEDVDIRSDLYQSRYPELKNIRENIDVNTVKNNLLVDCENDYLRSSEKQVFENNTSVGTNGKTLEMFCSPEILEDYGLQPIPIREIGPKNNKWIK